MPPTLHIYFQLHYYCGLHIDPTLPHKLFKTSSSGPELIGRTLDILMTKFVIDGYHMHM